MKWYDRCFSSLLASDIPVEILAVDNASTDDTVAYLQGNFQNVNVFSNETNLGFGRANNVGMRYALDHGADYVFLLNQDAWVMPDTFERLIAISQRHPEYAILSPFQMNADLQHIDKSFINRVCNWKSNSSIFNDLYNKEVSELYSVKVIMAAHWFMTRECILKIGGFSPTFPHYGEDDNYADRVQYWNLKMGIVPSLRVVNDRGDMVVKNEYQIHLCYVDALKALSKPNETFKAKVKKIWANLMLAVRYKSFLPIKNVFMILCHIKSIKRNLLISITQPCAFLSS